MDSLTQGLLGAATFALIKNKEIGKKSLLIGAVAGTIPDLDVFLAPLFNEIEFLTVHRSFSHSIAFAVLISIILGELFHRISDRKYNRAKWSLAFFLSIFTHSLLDWCTTYGTKLFSPFDDHLFSLNSIHVFEPIYTTILLGGVIIYSSKKKSIGPLKFALALSTLYLFVGMVSKNHAYYHFKTDLELNQIAYEEILVSPTPLNGFLWHGIAKTETGYHFATYSIFDGKKAVKFQFVKSNNEILDEIEKNRLVKYYLDYTQNFPLIQIDPEGNVSVFAIKYGPINYYGKPEFVYPLRFNINELKEEKIGIEYNGKLKGPVRNYKNLFKRIIGVT